MKGTSLDLSHVDVLVRRFAVPASRRAAGRTLSGLGLAGALTWVGDTLTASAKKGKKRKPKFKPDRNRFGCVDVGDLCTKNGQCCSGICHGTNRKKRCQAHDSAFGTCEAGLPDFCAVGGGLVAGTTCTTGADENGFCFTTTGNAPFCASNSVQDAGCAPCKKDADCQRFCGLSAACIDCPACAGQGGNVGTACGGIDDSCIF